MSLKPGQYVEAFSLLLDYHHALGKMTEAEQSDAGFKDLWDEVEDFLNNPDYGVLRKDSK